MEARVERRTGRRGLAIAAVLCLGVLAPSIAAAPQEPRAPQPREELRQARERWDRLSPEERDQIRSRWEQYKRMDSDNRRALHDRERRLESVRERWRERLPDEQRREMERLGPRERRSTMHRRFGEEFSRRGRRLREDMPPDLRRRLEVLPPEERGSLVHEYFSQRRRQETDRALERTRRDLRLTEDEVHLLESLPPEERFEAILALRRDALRRRVEAEGPPPWISPELWRSIEGLPPREFFEALHEARRGAPRPGGRRPSASPREQAWLDVREALRPDFGRRRSDPEGRPSERSPEGPERRREQVLERLERTGEVPPEELQRLGGLRGPEFFEAVRTLVEQHSPDPRGHPARRGPRGQRGPRSPGGRPERFGDPERRQLR